MGEEKVRGADRFLAAIAAAIAASLVLKFAFIAVTLGSDDIRYFLYARKLARLEPFVDLDHAASRLAFLGLIGVPGAWFGGIVWTSVVNIVVAAATEVLVAWYLWTRVGREAALAGTLFLSFSGVVLSYAGTFSPDTLLALLFVLALLLTFKHLDEPSRTTAVLLGAVMGLAYSAKDTGILLLPPVFFALVFLARRTALPRRVFDATLALAGFVFVWLLECFGLWLLSGDFLYRYSALSGVHNTMMGAASSLGEFIAKGYWNALIVFEEADLLLLPAVLAVAACILLVARGGAATTLALTIGFCALFLVAGSSSLSRLVNLPFQERYVQPLLPLVALAIGMVLGPAPRSAVLRGGTFALIGLAAVASIHGSLQRAGNRFFEPYLAVAATTAQSLALSAEKPLWTDARTLRGLRLLLDDATLRNIRELPERPLFDQGLVLLHPTYCCLSEIQRATLDRSARLIDTSADPRALARLFPGAVTRPARFRVTVYQLGVTGTAPGGARPAP